MKPKQRLLHYTPLHPPLHPSLSTPLSIHTAPPSSISSISLSDSRREAVSLTPRSLPAYHLVSEEEAYRPEMRWDRGGRVEGRGAGVEAWAPPPPPLPATAARAAACAAADRVEMTSPPSVRRGGNRMDGTRPGRAAAW